MLRKRVIPTLLLHDGGLVKTRRFKAPEYVGDPINAVKIFNEKEVDELFLLDIDASRQGRGPNVEQVREIVSEAFMPVAYGGGIRTVEEASQLLSAGIEKLVLNTAVLSDLSLVTRLKNAFGAQCVVGSIDVQTRRPLSPAVISHSHRVVTEPTPLAWAKKLVEAGVGELLIQDVQRDGTLEGLDLSFAQDFVGLGVPVVVAGGSSDVRQLKAVFQLGVSGVAVGAKFVFYGPHRAVLISYLSRSELDDLSGAPSVLAT